MLNYIIVLMHFHEAKCFSSFRFAELHLSSNHLSSLPDELRQITGLTSLDISHNNFNVMPPVVYRMEALHKLNAEKNEIKGQLLSIGVLVSGMVVKVLIWLNGVHSQSVGCRFKSRSLCCDFLPFPLYP